MCTKRYDLVDFVYKINSIMILLYFYFITLLFFFVSDSPPPFISHNL